MKKKVKILACVIAFVLAISFPIAITSADSNEATTEATDEVTVAVTAAETTETTTEQTTELETEEITKETTTKVIPTESKTTTESSIITTKASTTEKSTDNTSGEWIAFTATAYCGGSCCCGQWAGSPTASGKMPQPYHTIAVDTSIIPLGTTVEIQGMGTYVAEDTGSAIKGNKIDIYYSSHNEALSFGRQTIYVKILK
jgi:3D (Asp-Asp-Asp) domain-containing protein